MDSTLSPIQSSAMDVELSKASNHQDCHPLSLTNANSSVFISLPLRCTDTPLSTHMAGNKSVIRFLRLAGVIWSSQRKEEYKVAKVLQYCWNIGFIRLFLALGVFLYGGYSLVDGFMMQQVSFWTVGLCMIAQNGVMFPSLLSIQQRLNKVAAENDIIFYTDSVKWSYRILILTFLISCIYAIILYSMTTATDSLRIIWIAGIVFNQFAYACVLGANLLFIMLDCKVSSVLLDQLINLHKLDLLTLDKYNGVRTEIQNRVNNSYYLNWAIVVNSMLNFLTVLLLILTYSSEFAVGELGLCFLLLKEMPFLLIVFIASANVNEKSDKLTIMLGTDAWDVEHMTKCNSRLIIYANAEAKRISFPMAGLRMNHKDIRKQLFGWVLASVVAVVRAAVGKVA